MNKLSSFELELMSYLLFVVYRLWTVIFANTDPVDVGHCWGVKRPCEIWNELTYLVLFNVIQA